MKILIVNGSPRKNGNTRFILQALTKYIGSEDSVEFLDAYSLNVHACTACDCCKSNGGLCIAKDDSNTFIQKVIESDVLIFGTPVYWWGMSAQLKLLIDKFHSQDTELKKLKKKIGLIVVGASKTSDPQYKLIHDQFSCITNYLNWKLSFSLAFSAGEAGEIANNQNLDSILQEEWNNL